jgi:predicted metal-dependent HD superfamily phosphohydrolase
MFLDEFHRALMELGVSPLAAHKARAIIRKAYTRPSRHYHNLDHLENLYGQLLPVWDRLQEPNAVFFAIGYHDIIYNVRSTSNERRSAERAAEQLGLMGIDPHTIERCAAHIRATAGHGLSEDPDTNLFTDADLSILGAAPEAYALYAEQVRKEYAIYPDFLYKPGRRKVLEHFLAMDRIFKTDWFDGLYGAQARINLQDELDRS